MFEDLFCLLVCESALSLAVVCYCLFDLWFHVPVMSRRYVIVTQP